MATKTDYFVIVPEHVYRTQVATTFAYADIMVSMGMDDEEIKNRLAAVEHGEHAELIREIGDNNIYGTADAEVEEDEEEDDEA